MLQSLTQTLCLISPGPIGLWSTEHGTEDDDRSDRGESEKNGHLRSPFCATGVKDKATHFNELFKDVVKPRLDRSG
jgi:hypothetical protein